jgi:hypothetical protein
VGAIVDPVETLVQSHKGDQGEDERDDSEECRKPLYKDAKQASILSASCSCRDEMTIATPILIDRTHGQDEPREPAPSPKDGEQQSEEGQAGQSGRDGGDDQRTGETVGVTGDQRVVVLQGRTKKYNKQGKVNHRAITIWRREEQATHPDPLGTGDDPSPGTEPERPEPVRITPSKTDIVDAPDERGRERTQPEQDGSSQGEERGEDIVDRGASARRLRVGGGGGAHVRVLSSAEHCAMRL